MKKLILLVLSIALVCSTQSFGYAYFTNNWGTGDYLWTTASNWSGAGGSAVPDGTEGGVRLRYDSPEMSPCIIPLGYTGTANGLIMGDNQCTNHENPVLNIIGGYDDLDDQWFGFDSGQSDYGHGHVNLWGSMKFDGSKVVAVGGWNSGTMNMYPGSTVNVNYTTAGKDNGYGQGQFRVGVQYNDDDGSGLWNLVVDANGVSVVTMNNSTVDANDLLIMAGYIDMYNAAKIILSGDRQGDLWDMFYAGKILNSGVAYDDTGVTVDFDGTDTTMIVPEPATIALLGLGGLALLRKRR